MLPHPPYVCVSIPFAHRKKRREIKIKKRKRKEFGAPTKEWELNII
jgi:hypothetical protein